MNTEHEAQSLLLLALQGDAQSEQQLRQLAQSGDPAAIDALKTLLSMGSTSGVNIGIGASPAQDSITQAPGAAQPSGLPPVQQAPAPWAGKLNQLLGAETRGAQPTGSATQPLPVYPDAGTPSINAPYADTMAIGQGVFGGAQAGIGGINPPAQTGTVQPAQTGGVMGLGMPDYTSMIPTGPTPAPTSTTDQVQGIGGTGGGVTSNPGPLGIPIPDYTSLIPGGPAGATSGAPATGAPPTGAATGAPTGAPDAGAAAGIPMPAGYEKAFQNKNDLPGVGAQDQAIKYLLGGDNWMSDAGYSIDALNNPRFSFSGGPDPITGYNIKGDPTFVLDSYLKAKGLPEGMRNTLADDIASMPGLMELMHPGQQFTEVQRLAGVDPFVQEITKPGQMLNTPALYDNLFSNERALADLGTTTPSAEAQLGDVFAGLQALAPYLGNDAYTSLNIRLNEAAKNWKIQNVKTSGGGPSFLEYLRSIHAQDWI